MPFGLPLQGGVEDIDPRIVGRRPVEGACVEIDDPEFRDAFFPIQLLHTMKRRRNQRRDGVHCRPDEITADPTSSPRSDYQSS